MGEKKINSLTQCELQVMKCIWDSTDKICLPVITEKVNRTFGKNWKPQTVSTYLARMASKRFLTFKREGRAFFYETLISKEEYRKKEATEFIRFWFEGDAEAAALYLKEMRVSG